MDFLANRPQIDIAEQSQSSSQSHALRQMTINEYDQIQQRLEETYKVLDLVKDALSSSENLDSLRPLLEQQCEHMTLRVKIIKKQKQVQSITNKNLTLHVFKVEFCDIEQRKGFFMVKHAKSRSLQLPEGQSYLLDKVKLVINKKGELVISSTSITVIREEKEDSFEIDSLELSQKDEDELEYKRQQQQHQNLNKKQTLNNQQSNNYYNYHQDSDYDHDYDYYNQQNNKNSGKFLGGVDLQKLTNFQSTKQIVQTCEDILKEDALDESEKKLYNFRELLTWKLPEQFCSNVSKNVNKVKLLGDSNNNGGLIVNNQIHLYRLDFVTQRVKEQRVSFCGIVSHVKMNVDKQDLKSNHVSNQSTSQIDLESIDDKSRVCLFVKHSNHLNLKELIIKDMIILIKNGLRKVSNTIDIYVQLQYSPKSLIVVGQVKEQINDFQASTSIQLIKTIPSDAIVRHIIKICGFIAEINFIKIQYKCDVCKTETMNESVCRNGCFIKTPFLAMQVLCIVQDGTSKASLDLKNEKVIKAFSISENDIRRFKDYCLKHGTFIHPSNSAYNFHYRDIISVFKKNESWTQMLFYCKAYYKSSYEKKGGFGSGVGGQASGMGGSGYNDTISKPTFILKDQKEKEVYLNGEVTSLKDVAPFRGDVSGSIRRTIKKTNVCLKCLQVDDNLKAQAMRNVFLNKQQQ